MKIINETELMTNQKASTTVLPDVEFEALQTAAGNSLLFSISSDNKFYCTYELPGDTHGWQRAELSDSISKNNFGGQAVTVKSFDLGQDLVAGTLDLVLVVKDMSNQDWLCVSLSNTDSGWSNFTPVWQKIQFDDPNNTQYNNAFINDVFVARFGSNQFIFADIISNTESQALARYAVDPTGQVMLNTVGVQQCWIPHTTAMTLTAGKISSAVGCGPGDESVNGIYTLYAMDGNPQLVYAPLFNGNDPGGAPFPTDFDLTKLSVDSTHMAMAISKPLTTSPDTDLFFASNGVLYFSPNVSQVNTNGVNPVPAQIYTHDLFQKVESLHVDNWNGNIVLWGQSTDPVNSQVSRLFVMECVGGHETNADAWSCPIPLLLNVENATTYIHNGYSSNSSVDPVNGNAYGSCSVIFAHQADGSLVQLFQDPITTAWQQRFLLTAPLDVQTEIFETTTYSTHIEVTDDNGITQPNVPVAVWASSPCSVYITDANKSAAYYTLDTAIPVQLTADVSGNITIMQPVDSIGGIAYYLAVKDAATTQIYTQAINPMAKTVASLNSKVPDGDKDYLQGVQVTDENNNSTQLVSSAYASQTPSTSNNINTICQQNANLNQDGLVTGQAWPDAATVAAALVAVQAPGHSAVVPAAIGVLSTLANVAKPTGNAAVVAMVKPVVKRVAKADRPFRNVRFNPKTDKIWGWTFGENAKHYQGIDAVKYMGVSLNADGSLSLSPSTAELGSIFSHIEAKIGHVIKWMQSEANKLEQAIITFTDGVVDCLLTIAGKIYHFVAKCANDIVHLVHTVLNAIETAFEDIVKWIGMIFSFGDIKNTHLVLKNMMNVYIDYVLTNIGSLDGSISTLFTNIQTDLSNALGVTSTDQTYGGNMANASAPSGSKSPGANWGNSHLKSNAANSSANYVSVTGDPIKDLLDVLYQKVVQEGENFESMGNSFLALVETAAGMSITELLANVLNIVSDFLLNTAEDMLTTAVDVVKVLLSDFDHMLNQTMNIPVLSYLYKKITGDDLTPLDVACFIGAIPATVVYKIVRGTAPFPDADPTTAQLINATDLNAMQAILVPPALMGATIGISDYHVVTGSVLDRITIAANISAFAGAVATSFITAFKSLSTIKGMANNLSDPLADRLTVLNAGVYFLYAAPDIVTLITTAGKTATDKWYNVMNNMCMILGGAKAIVDATTPLWPAPPGLENVLSAATKYGNYIAPALDFIINLAWQIPTTAILVTNLAGRKASVEDANDIVGFIGGTTFDLSGMLSPVLAATSLIEDLPKKEAAVAVVTAGIGYFNLIWGGACVVTSFDGIHTT